MYQNGVSNYLEVYNTQIRYSYFNVQNFLYLSNIGIADTYELGRNSLCDGRLICTFDTAKATTINNPLFLFAYSNSGRPSYFIDGQIYNFKIYDKHQTKLNFIPVPKGMVINGYVVPENGMWDTVEQKFYGNSGTGEFIYGVDE